MSADLEARLRAAMQAEVGQLPVLLTADAVADRIDRSNRRWRTRLAFALATLTLGLAGMAALLVASGFLQADRERRGGLPDVHASPTATFPLAPTSEPVGSPSPNPASPTPPITPAPTASPEAGPPSDAVICQEAAVNIVDRHGIVAECVTWWVPARYPAYQFPEDHKTRVENPDDDQSVIDVFWAVADPTFCRSATVTLELVPLSDSPEPAILFADETTGRNCEIVGLLRRGARMSLRRPVSAEHVIFLEGKLYRDDEEHEDGMAVSFQEPALGVKGRLGLSLAAGQASYAQGESIELEAILRYQRDADGPSGNVTFFGAAPKYGFVYDQLDGDAVIWDGQIADCEPLVMEPVEEIRLTSGVQLPPGRWRISVAGDFSPHGCDGERFRFNPYVIVTVE